MEPKKNVRSLKSGALLVVAVFIFLASCQKDSSILNSTDTQNVNAESASSAYISEGSDISANAVAGLSATQYAGTRVDGEIVNNLMGRDDRFKCATVIITRTGTKENPAGFITITFDPSCLDKRGIKRSG